MSRAAPDSIKQGDAGGRVWRVGPAGRDRVGRRRLRWSPSRTRVRPPARRTPTEPVEVNVLVTLPEGACRADARVCGSSKTSLIHAAESARFGERTLGCSQSAAATSAMCPSCAISIEKCPRRLTLPGPPAPVRGDQLTGPAGVGASELEQDAPELLARVGRATVLPVDDAHPALGGGQARCRPTGHGDRSPAPAAARSRPPARPARRADRPAGRQTAPPPA